MNQDDWSISVRTEWTSPKLSPITAPLCSRYLRVLLRERESRCSRPRCAENQDGLDGYQADDAARPFAYRHFPLTALATGSRCVNRSVPDVSGAHSGLSVNVRRLGSTSPPPPPLTASCSRCAVKWSRRRQALAVEASRTVGDALMQLPRHCRVSPPAPTYTTDSNTTAAAATTQAGASTTALSHQQPRASEARSRSPGNRGRAGEESSLVFIYLCRATWDLSST